MQPSAVSVLLAVIVVVVAAIVLVVVVVLIVATTATAALNNSTVGSRGNNVNVVALIIEPKGQRTVMCREVLDMVTAPSRFRAVSVGHHT